MEQHTEGFNSCQFLEIYSLYVEHYNMKVSQLVCIIPKLMKYICFQRLKYFSDFSNLIEWSLYLNCGLFVFPSLFGYMIHTQWECGAVAVFLAWFNLLLYLQR